MKKLFLIIGLFFTISNAPAFTLSNETNQTIKVSVSYKDWWFEHSYSVGAWDTNFLMNSGLDPQKNATYVIQTSDGQHKWMLNCSTMARLTVRNENSFTRLYIGNIPVV